MSTPQIDVPAPWLAQTPEPAGTRDASQMWMMTSGGLALLIVILGIISTVQFNKLQKKLKFEQYKNRELHQKMKMSMRTITKMERNPDLIHSRDINLDYIRMRMDEDEVFHTSILNQLKVKVKDSLQAALRPKQAESGMVGVASKPRQIDEIFDIKLAAQGTERRGIEKKERVVFRIQFKLAKLPTQTTSATISQIIECIETFLSEDVEEMNWQPTIQGRLAQMHWDQKAKPTPLLVLAQSAEGVNVTFRSSNRSISSPNIGAKKVGAKKAGIKKPVRKQHKRARA
ncbi:MAG: hypothetical protein AAGF66_04510 [Cyanobacteria bacterium P01_H01_bin.119]